MIGSLQNKIRETFERYRSDANTANSFAPAFSLIVRMIGVGTGFW